MLSPQAEACFEFLKNQQGEYDVVMFCDGRSIKCRRSCEDASKHMRNLHEAWVVHKPTTRSMGRRVAFGADNKETILVSMPIARVKMTAAPRAEFHCAGEETTHETTYTGVPTAPWGSLPLLEKSQKQELTGRDPPASKDTVFDASLGMPLFWQERKTPDLWKRLLRDVKGKAVFDLTPGSGTLARSCMELGVSYAGVCRSATQALWLMNICDRQALRQLCTKGLPLYHQSVSQCIEAHFRELLDFLNDQDAAEDTEAPEAAVGP